VYLNKTYSKVHIRKNMSNAVPIQNDLKEGDALSSLLLTSLYNIPWISPKKLRKKWNWMEHMNCWWC